MIVQNQMFFVFVPGEMVGEFIELGVFGFGIGFGVGFGFGFCFRFGFGFV